MPVVYNVNTNLILARNKYSVITYPEPPFAFPYTPDFLPKLVRISIPSIQAPALT